MVILRLSSFLPVLRRTLGFAALVMWGNAFAQDDYAKQWAPPIGSAMPMLEAPDQSGVERNLQNLAGEQGLLLFLNRSADW